MDWLWVALRTSVRWVGAVVAAAFLATIAGGWAPEVGDASAATGAGRRITIGMFGDSVTQGIVIPDFQQVGLVPQLLAAEGRFGYVSGGAGLLSASPYFWHYSQAVNYTGTVPATGWTTLGTALGDYGTDGLSGFSSLTSSADATATATVDDPDIEVLYDSMSVHCPFTVTTATESWTIDPYRPGPQTDTGTAIQIPPGEQSLTVHGPACGTLSFDGVIAQEPVLPGQTSLVIDNLGHAGELPFTAFTPQIAQAIRAEHFNLSVFLWGYMGEVLENAREPGRYVNTLVRRARIAREHGGACLIADPTPIVIPPYQLTDKARRTRVRTEARLDQLAALRGGCTYTTVLAHLWQPRPAIQQGLLVSDGIHPTAAGYTLMAHALAPVVARMLGARQ